MVKHCKRMRDLVMIRSSSLNAMYPRRSYNVYHINKKRCILVMVVIIHRLSCVDFQVCNPFNARATPRPKHKDAKMF